MEKPIIVQRWKPSALLLIRYGCETPQRLTQTPYRIADDTPATAARASVSAAAQGCCNYFPRLAGGTIPFMRRYSIICP